MNKKTVKLERRNPPLIITLDLFNKEAKEVSSKAKAISEKRRNKRI
jgi:hypothetical protein